MRRLSVIMLLAALTLSYSCTEPDNTGSVPNQGQDSTPGGEGNQDGDGSNEGDDSVEPKYKAGDYFKEGLAEGIIAYVDESGEHGLIISIDETTAQWSTEHHMLTVMGGEFSFDDGAGNSAYVRSQENWTELYPAFAWCHNKNILGLSAWYLPATYELAKAYESLEAINATLTEMGEMTIANGVNDLYWSSVEIGVQSAYPFSFNIGDISSYDTDKKIEHRVRAMRKF